MRHATTHARKATVATRHFIVALLISAICGMANPIAAIAAETGLDGNAARGALALAETLVAETSPQINAQATETDSQDNACQEGQGMPSGEAQGEALATLQDGAPDSTPPAGASGDATPDTAQPVEDTAAQETGSQSEPNAPIAQGEAFAYQHDPRNNPSAMADIIEDESAVYGFSPSLTGSLRDYATYDWSDPSVVEAGRQQRITYHEGFSELYGMIDQMKAAGASTEEIARAVSTRRNEMRLETYKDDPEGLAKVKARNLEKYGNENGGTPEFFFQKYGSWEKVIEKSLSVNSGMDACTGLYDVYYELYVAAGQVPPDPTEQDDRGEPTGDEPTSNEPTVQQANEEKRSSSASNGNQPLISDTPSAKLPATGDATPPASVFAILACACFAAAARLQHANDRAA